MSEATTTEDADGAGSLKGALNLPPKLSELRQKLYDKAKKEPTFRFYALYDRIYRLDVLRAAFTKVASNDGGPGVDGLRVEDVQRQEGGVEAFLERLHEALKTKTYRPEAVRRCYIPKPDGRERPLGIPTIRDRVVQTAAMLILEPIFEADFQDCSFGFRPERSAHDAMRAILKWMRQGRYTVIDADLKSYFDSIPHDKLMVCVAKRISDGSVLELIRMWLKAPIEEPPDRTDGKPRRHRPPSGTPQGGVISPLLANLYLHWLDVPFGWKDGPGVFANAKLVRYADDFVILARDDHGGRIMRWLRNWVEGRMGLQINEEKTHLRCVGPDRDPVDFLGFTIQSRRGSRTGRPYLHTGPSAKSLKRVRARIRELASHHWGRLPIAQVIRRLNAYLTGWAGYFRFGHCGDAFNSVSEYAQLRVYRHLRRRSQRPYMPPADKTWYQHLHHDLGLLRLTAADAQSRAWS